MTSKNNAADPKPLILYFVKLPEVGKVKTRLAQTVGDAAAAEIYRELALKNFDRIKSLGSEFNVAVLYDPPESQAAIREWLSGADFYRAQEGNDLGTRLKCAVDWAFEKTEQVFLLGSDTLRLDAEILTDALMVLNDFDTVLGPAADGGYYLFGMNEPLQTVFDGIDWSTEFVLSQTKNKLNELALSYGELKSLADLDEWPRDKSREELNELIRI